MIRSFVTVSTGTLSSRLLGFARDSLIAALLGAGPIADAFFLAFQLTNVVRRLLSEGALNAALVPAWLRVRDREGPTAAAAFAGRVLGSVSLVVVIAAVLIGIAMPFVVTVLAPGFAGQETLGYAVTDARLMLPYLAFAGPVTVLMAVLNAQGRFAVTAFSPVLFNLALIATVAALLFVNARPGAASTGLAAAIGIAGFLQLAMLLSAGSRKLATPLRAGVDPQMRSFFAKAVPGMLASSCPQWLMLCGAIVASGAPSMVSWLYFANRLIELPLGIVGVATGAVLIPELSRAVGDADRSASAHAQSRALELAAGLALPATVGLMVLSEPIVRLLFEHGAFTAADTAETAQALTWLSLGLPAHVLTKALSPAFYARHDTRTPLWAALIGFVVALGLAASLGDVWGAWGIAAGLAAGATATAAFLLVRAAATPGWSLDPAARIRLPRILLAAALMGALLWLAVRFIAPPGLHGGVWPALVLLGLVAAAMAVYLLLLRLLGVVIWGKAFRAVLQHRSSGDLRG